MENEVTDIYIHETHTIWYEYGEVHIMNDKHHIVWDADSLFNDLDGLMHFAIKARQLKEESLINSMKMQIKTLRKTSPVVWDDESAEKFIEEYKELRKRYAKDKNNTTTKNR